MRQQNPRGFSYDSSIRNPVTFTNPKGNRIQFKVVNDNVVRVLHTAAHQFSYDLTDEGTAPEFEVQINDEEKQLVFETGALRVVVNFKRDLNVTWYAKSHPGAPLLEDLPNRAYPADLATGAVWHYLKCRANDMYYGLGERTGELKLNGRRFRLERLDCMGYDAERSDPLYKFCPFYLTLSNDTHLAHGIFYNNMSRSTVDLGNENDALWGPYRYYHAEAGPLDYYIFFGPSVQSVIENFSSLVGKPEHLPPRYSFGYLASSMGYAEADNAQELLEKFPELCRQHDIPCDGLHLSSGYTVTEERKERCVFTWNKSRFPDGKRLMAKLRDAGIHVFANIKPWLLETHPYYDELRALRGFIWNDEEDVPGEVMQWSAGPGESAYCAYVDFTSRQGFDWWKQHVKSQLLDYGLAGAWNDNNEFTMLDDAYSFANEVRPTLDLHRPLPEYRTESSVVGTPIQTLLMAQASYEAMREYAPDKRPFVITRSATPFIHRYVAQTWSGDNYTEWKTIKYNIPMGMSAGLSIFPGAYGHDVGGFAGLKPDPELFVRWVQNGILNPRFCIHSWNSDQTVTEPWMYPSVLPMIRSSIQFRYRLIPYIYSHYVEFHRTGHPIIRPLFYHFQHDSATYEQSFDYMLGASLLVASVFEPNATTRRVYLPGGSNWYHFQTGRYYTGGQEIELPAPLDDACSPVLVPEGTLLPLGKVMRHVGHQKDDERVVHVYPPRGADHYGKRFEATLVEDDGVTTAHTEKNEYAELKIWMVCDAMEVRVGIDIVHALYRPEYDVVSFVVADEEETRRLVADGDGVETKVDSDGKKLVSVPLLL